MASLAGLSLHDDAWLVLVWVPLDKDTYNLTCISHSHSLLPRHNVICRASVVPFPSSRSPAQACTGEFRSKEQDHLSNR